MRGRPAAVVAALGACVLVAASASGESILQAGNDPPPATTTTAPAPPATAAPGETLAPTTPPTIATTTTTPLASLPACPVDALDEATAPVEITFWFGLAAETEGALIALTEEYNASQDRAIVHLENQGGYKELIDKYVQSSQESRPHMTMLPEYVVQQMADSATIIPVGACIEADGFDTAPILQRALLAYQAYGVQWSMPFNVSNPVLYYNRAVFEAAGLDPDVSPVSLEELRDMSQVIVDTGAAGTGIALDSGVDSGGGWFLEQWFARADELYADNGNGRVAPATRVLYDGPVGVALLSEVQSLINDGLAVSVGDNPGGRDALFRMADPAQPAAMAIATSAALSSVLSILSGGVIPGFTPEMVGVGPMPGPGDIPSATVGGASLYIVAERGDAQAAAAWDYIKFLMTAQSQSTWAAGTGYVPIHDGALELDPIKTTYETDPRFKVAYEQLVAGTDDLASLGPILGPQREVRSVTASAVAAIFGGADVASSLTAAATQSNALITDYNVRN